MPFVDARWQIEAAPDEHTEMRQPTRASESATVVLTVLSPALRNRCILPNPFVQRDRTPASNIVDNEHQSSCAITGSRTGCSHPTPTLSTIAARPFSRRCLRTGAQQDDVRLAKARWDAQSPPSSLLEPVARQSGPRLL